MYEKHILSERLCCWFMVTVLHGDWVVLRTSGKLVLLLVLLFLDVVVGDVVGAVEAVVDC